MPELMVVLHLILWDADTGSRLGDEYTVEFHKTPNAQPQPDLIEECRLKGLDLAYEAVGRWRKVKPNAFANVDCQWEPEGDRI